MRTRLVQVLGLVLTVVIATPALAQEEESSTASQWARVDDGPWSSLGKGDDLMGPLTLEDGSLVVVTRPTDGGFTSWVSDDGVTWTQSDPIDASGMFGTGLMTTHDGVAVLAIDPLGMRSSVFESVDGLEWTSWQPEDALVTNGSAAADATYLAGLTGKPAKLAKAAPAIWRSLGGEPFELLSLRDVRKTGQAVDVAALPTDELLVLTMGDDGLQLHRGTWDGDWETLKTPATKKGQLWYASLAPTPEGVVLGIKQQDSGIWFSADGSDWQVVAEPEGELRIVESRDGLYTTPRVWRSSDGQTWCGLGRPGSGKNQATGVAPLADGGLLAVGSGLTKNKKALHPIAFITDAPICVPLEPGDASNVETDEPND